MPQVPSHVLELYESGDMPTADMDEFEALVTSGELTIGSGTEQPQQTIKTPAQEKLVTGADLESIQGMLSGQPSTAPIQPESNGSESTTATFKEPEITPDISDLKQIGFESKGEQEWPTASNVLPKKIFNDYQTRALDFNTRKQVEEAINNGDYVLPQGKTLNIPTSQDQKPLMNRVSDVLSGADRKGGADYPSVLSSPEAIRAGAGFLAMASTAGQEERAKMAEGIGFVKSRDFFNNPVLTSKETGDKYMVPSGFNAADMIGATLVGAPSAAVATVMAPVTAGYGLLAGATIMATTDAAIEAAVQTGQKVYGGDFDKLDVAIAGGLSVFSEAASAGVALWGKRKIINTVKDAVKGDPRAISELAKMYKKDKAVIDIATESINVKYNPVKNSFDDSLDFKESLKNLAENPDSQEAKELLARKFKVNKGSIESFEKAGIEKEMNIADIADRSDTKTSGVIRSIYSEGTDSIEEQTKTRASKIKDTFVKKMQSMGATKDKGLLSKNIKETMNNYVKKNKAKAKVMYDDLKPVLRKGTADASETLGELKRLKEEWNIAVRKGEIVVDKDSSNPFTAIEKEVMSALSPKKVVTKPSTILDFQGNPIGSAGAERFVDPPLIRLNTLRKKVGSMIKDMNITNYEQFKSLDLNKMLKRDEAISVQNLADKLGDQSIYSKWEASDKLWKDAKDVEKNMTDLFTDTLEHSMFRDVKSKTQEMFEGSIGKMKVMLNSLPKAERSTALKASLLDAMGRNQDLMEIDKLGKWYNGFKDNSEGMNLLKKYLDPEDFESFKAIGEAGSAIEGSKKHFSGGKIGKIEKDVGAKQGLISNMLGAMGTLAAGGSLATMLTSTLPAGVATTALSLTAYGAVRGIKKHVSKNKFASFVDVLKSKAFLDLVSNQDSLEIGIQKLSMSKEMKKYAKLMLIGSDPKDIKQFIKNGLKSATQTEQRLNEDMTNDLQTPQQ